MKAVDDGDGVGVLERLNQRPARPLDRVSQFAKVSFVHSLQIGTPKPFEAFEHDRAEDDVNGAAEFDEEGGSERENQS